MCEGIKNHRFRPKARKHDVEAYVESCMAKFGCCETSTPGDDLAGKSYDSHVISCDSADRTGFPLPIQESIKVLRDHIYEPLSDFHSKQEEEIEKRR